MKKILLLSVILIFGAASMLLASPFDKDTIKTNNGDLEITFIGHASLMFKYNGTIIYLDPFSRLADFSKLPKADMILITHHHGDHMDAKAVEALKKETTQTVMTKICGETIKSGTVMANGDTKTVGKFKIEAVPAYNITHKRPDGSPFHPKGEGNGYIITFGDKRVYVAGDTENTPEMKALKNIDAAFLPANLPYTMTGEMVAAAAAAFKPKILYPYHFTFANGQVPQLEAAMKKVPGVDVRVFGKKK